MAQSGDLEGVLGQVGNYADDHHQQEQSATAGACFDHASQIENGQHVENQMRPAKMKKDRSEQSPDLPISDFGQVGKVLARFSDTKIIQDLVILAQMGEERH